MEHSLIKRLGLEFRWVSSPGGMGRVREPIVPRERWKQCENCGMSEGMIGRLGVGCRPTGTTRTTDADWGLLDGPGARPPMANTPVVSVDGYVARGDFEHGGSMWFSSTPGYWRDGVAVAARVTLLPVPTSNGGE